MIVNCIQSWFQSPLFKDHQQAIEDFQLENNQEILNSELLEEEHQEQLRVKELERAVKAAGIAERKRLRIEKAARFQALKEEKQLLRQRSLACKNIEVSL